MSRWSTRRRLPTFLVAVTVAAVAVITGLVVNQTSSTHETSVSPSSQQVTDVERARPVSGRTVTREITARQATVDIGGRSVNTWTLDGVLPGRELRVGVGDRLRVTLHNRLPAETSLHWHGLELRNDMDGAPGAGGPPAVAPGGTFTYDFVVPSHPGTYFVHSHVGTQLDRGLYAPLIVEDPAVRGDDDADEVLMLDDWTDGLGRSPDQVLADLRARGMAGMSDKGSASTGMPGMDHGSMAGTGSGDPHTGGMGPGEADSGDVQYPAYLINGRRPEVPYTLAVRPGQRVRLRLVNAGSDTVFRFAVGGHQLTVTDADGRPVQPVTVDTLLIGMGERYDVVITAGTGTFPIFAAPEGKDGMAMAVLRTAAGSMPDPAVRPAELNGRLLSYRDLTPVPNDVLPARPPDRVLNVDLGADAVGYRWTINGRTFENRSALQVRQGERLRLVFRNTTMMNHPMHVHGHTFALQPPTSYGARKDVVIVPPMQTVTVDLQADNPGQWMVHCHNSYHQAAGMMTVLSYVTN